MLRQPLPEGQEMTTHSAPGSLVPPGPVDGQRQSAPCPMRERQDPRTRGQEGECAVGEGQEGGGFGGGGSQPQGSKRSCFMDEETEGLRGPVLCPEFLWW